MTELSSAEFCKLTIQDVADMLLDQLAKNDDGRSSCKLYGCSEGQMFEMTLVMKEVEQ